jgi:outer membrane protein assembly factor BamA
VGKRSLVFASCSLGILFLCGFAVAQSSVDLDSKEKDAKAADAKRCLESTCRKAPLREKLAAIPLHIKYMRGIVGGFEQGAGIGGGVQLTSADALPSLELRATALTSSRFYRRFDLEGYVPNIGGSRNHADAWFSYMRRESDFFGIGPLISRDLKTNFDTEQRSYQGSLYRDIADHFQGGVYTQVTNSHSSRGKLTTDTPIDENFSGTPDQPLTPWIPGFLSNTKILSYGAFLEYDARDYGSGLARGVDLYGRVASNDALDDHAAFADYGWIEAEFDIRGYAPLGGARTSLALRSKGEFKKPKGASQIPFYDLTWLGGREYVRGYELYRFRGNNLLLFSTELRRTVYSTTDLRGVDVFAFADSGQVWGDARSTTDPLIRANQNFSSSNWHSGVGGGLQYRHSRSLAGRLEVGRSNEGALIYLSMSRGF